MHKCDCGSASECTYPNCPDGTLNPTIKTVVGGEHTAEGARIELQILAGEKKAFEAGFRAGFSISFDGWNGQVFDEFNRPLDESTEFMDKLNKLLEDYNAQVREQSNLLSFVMHMDGPPKGSSPGTYRDALWPAVVRTRESRKLEQRNGAPIGSLPSPLYPRTIQGPTFFSDNPDHYHQPAATDSGEEHF